MVRVLLSLLAMDGKGLAMDGKGAAFWWTRVVVPLATATLVSQAGAQPEGKDEEFDQEASASPEPEAAEDDPTDWHPPDENDKTHEPQLPGVVLRAGAEYSQVRYFTRMSGGRTSEGVNTSFEKDFEGSSSAWGARLLGGVGFEVSDVLGIVPRLSAGAHSLGPQDFSITIAGVPHRWRASLTYWTVALGCELSFLDRVLLVSFEGGGAGLTAGRKHLDSIGLELEIDDIGGVYGRADVGLRFPADFPVGGGLSAGFDGFWTVSELPISYRVSGGLFIDFDMGRM